MITTSILVLEMCERLLGVHSVSHELQAVVPVRWIGSCLCGNRANARRCPHCMAGYVEPVRLHGDANVSGYRISGEDGVGHDSVVSDDLLPAPSPKEPHCSNTSVLWWIKDIPGKADPLLVNTRARSLLSHAWNAWRLPPWPLRPFREQSTAFKLWILAVPLLQILLSAALWVTYLPSVVDDLMYAVIAMVVTAAVCQLPLREDAHGDFAFEQVIALAMIVAGRPVEALFCILTGPVISAIRQPIKPHMLLVNIANGSLMVACGAVLFAKAADGAPTMSGPWLFGALLVWAVIDLASFLFIDVMFHLGNYLSLRHEWRSHFRTTASSLVSTLPQAIVMAVAVSQPSYWYLLTLLLPFAVAYDIFHRSDQLVEATLQNRHLQSTFSQYVPASVVEQLVDRGTEVELGGEQREISVLFMDIRGFTTWSEQHEPSYIVDRLNDLLGILTDCVFETEGTLDKFTGDGLMAFWGAPLDQSDHADRACTAARAMVNALIAYNAGRPEDEQFRLGIGVHSGRAVVGNVGHDDRHDYTAIGDTVNLAARIEAATKDLDASLLISIATFEQLSAAQGSGFQAMGSISVKGRIAPIDVLAFSDADRAQAA